MATSTLTISPRVLETRDLVRCEFELRYSGPASGQTLFYEFPRELAPPPECFDGVLCAVTMHAMAGRHDVHLRGPATESLLRHLAEFQLAWSRWLPEVYTPVAVTADTVVTMPRVQEDRTLAAFSGGVDASFTLLTNTVQALGSPSQGLDTVMMVQGFDVALDNYADLRELVARTEPIRQLAGVRLLPIRTNSKELRLQKWEDSCGAELAACLHMCAGGFTRALIASSEPYDALVLPWGTNPLTDHLLSGGHLAIVHHGAAFSRTEKIAYLAGFPTALASLKVCWRGERKGRNCGVCEKCIRTQLNLLAVGVPHAPCFDESLDLRRIESITIRNDVVLNELRSILRYAEARQLDGEWVRLVRQRVRRGKRNWTVRSRVRRSLGRSALIEAARRLQRQLAFPPSA
jgi:hypothetical protein